MVGEDPAPRPVRHLPGGEGEDEVVVAGEDADILRGHDVSHTPILCLILVIIMSYLSTFGKRLYDGFVCM